VVVALFDCGCKTRIFVRGITHSVLNPYSPGKSREIGIKRNK